jgi:hypothetical protein
MAEPTTQRITLRREIAKDLGMPFFRRFPSGVTLQDTATSGLGSISDAGGIRDSRFTQERDYWQNSWMYVLDTAAGGNNHMMRKTVDFRKHDRTLVPEFDFDSAPSTGASLEIFNIHTPEEIHDAINDAIVEGFPVFFDVVTDETLVVEEDKLEYELVTNNSDGRGILSNPYRIKSIWVERVGTGGNFVQDTASTTTSIVNDAGGFSAAGIDATWRLGVYAGTGAGQLIVPTGAANANAIPVTAPTVALDTTSQIRFWNAGEELYRWEELSAIDFDAKDYPNKMRLRHPMRDKRGLRFRIQYVGEPQELTSDTASTQIPRKYIKHVALGKLLRQRARTKPGEIDKYAALAQQEDQDAAQFKIEHSFDLPDQTTWTEDDVSRERGDFFEIDNPLDW